MTPEQATIFGAVIQAGATVILGLVLFFAGLWIGRRQHATRQLMEYDVSSTSLLPSEMRSPLSVSIDKEIITGNPADHGNSTPVERAYAFFVTARNVGSETITQPTIEITLDDSATIVQIETDPKSIPQYMIVTNKDASKANIIRVIPPYISSKESITITTLSIQNRTSECYINIFGPGIKLRPARQEIIAPELSGLMQRALVFLTLFLGVVIILPYILPLIVSLIYDYIENIWFRLR